MKYQTYFASLYYGLSCSLYHVDDGIDWQDATTGEEEFWT